VLFSLLLVRPSGSALLRTGCLTPYVAETITTEALRAGHGSHLLPRLATGAPEDEVERVAKRLTCLRGRGVRVTVTVAWKLHCDAYAA
jgi:hypothetical protein